MKPKTLQLRSLFLTFLFGCLAQASAWAIPGHRLIEIQSGQKVWMTETEISNLNETTHREGRCGGYMDVTDYPELPELFLQPIAGLGNLEVQENRAVEAALSVLSANRMRADVQKLSSFHNRYYQSESGEAAALWIRDQFQTLGRPRNDIKVELFRHSGWRQPSVIATIAGSGPNAAETVILGAHLDSISSLWGFPNPNGKAPGADDDASGVATLLETYRSLVETGFRPDRSIAFIAYAAEERGLLGSQEISRAWRQQGKQVRAVLQLDMTMFPGTTRAITFVTDHVNPELTRFSTQLVDTYVKAPWSETQCGYACSDHASWTKLGYAAAFPFEATFDGSNQDIHTERDLIGLLDMEHGLHFAKLGAAFAIELANEAP